MPSISRSQLALYAVAVLAVLVLGLRYLQRQAAPAPPPAAAAHASGVRVERSAPATALVHVAGEVRRPGVYRLSAGARVQDAIRRAGGARAHADVDAINLAGKVGDGQQIVVPRRGAVAGAPAGAADGPGPAAGPINLNTATIEQLDTLDGIGPVTAQKILDWRAQHGGFRSVDDLAQIPGIGPKRLAALREKVQA